MTTLTEIIGSEKGNEGQDRVNPIDLAAEVTKQLREQAQKEKREITKYKLTHPESIPENSKFSNSNSDLLYVPSAKLYFSDVIKFPGRNFYDIRNILHSHNVRMPTIPEYIKLLKHLSNTNSLGSKLFVVNTPFMPNQRVTGEWLDAIFVEGTQPWPLVMYHTFEKNGTIIKDSKYCKEQEKNVSINPGIGFEDWLNIHTAQGLPIPEHMTGFLAYEPPIISKGRFQVASFYTTPSFDIAKLNCNTNPYLTDLGVRYVSRTPDKIDFKIKKIL